MFWFYLIWFIEVLALLSMLLYLLKHPSAVGRLLAAILVVAALNDGLALFGLTPAWMNTVKLDLVIFLQWAGYLSVFFLLLTGRSKKVIAALLVSYVLTTAAFSVAAYLADVGHYFIPYTAGALFILASILLYFHQDLVVEQNEGSLLQRFYPLIFAGLFIWIAAEIPIMTSIEFLKDAEVPETVMVMMYAKIVASAVYYLCYPAAIIWSMRSS